METRKPITKQAKRHLPAPVPRPHQGPHIAKLFSNGRSQAVRLPVDCRFNGDEVYVKKLGKSVLLTPKNKADVWTLFQEGLAALSEDFMSERSQPETQQREDLFE